MEQENFIDVWRVMNEDKKQYTWGRLNPTKKQARLDYFLVSDTTFSFVTHSDIVPGYRTDHSGIILKLKLQESERGRGYWKFNNTLLKDKKYIEDVKATLREIKNRYKINEANINDIPDNEIEFNINDQLFLETLLMTIRGNTIKYSSIKKRKKLEDEHKLEQEIKQLEDEINNDFSNIDDEKILNLSQKKTILSDIRKEKIEGVMLRSRSRYQDLGEKPSKYFFNLENRNFVNKAMNKIIENDGTEYSETKEIIKCQQKFYENLYSDISNDVDGNPIEDIVGENENKLSNDESQKLEGDIKLGELSNSLKNMKNDKSPGLDGFTVEFFKFFWTDLKYFILRSLNYGYRTGSLSVTQKQGIITCLPKPGKSRHYLKNWRPISLLNVVYKSASSVIANRLKTTLDRLINQDQKGFISGRFIGENVRLMYDILFATRNDNIP